MVAIWNRRGCQENGLSIKGPWSVRKLFFLSFYLILLFIILKPGSTARLGLALEFKGEALKLTGLSSGLFREYIILVYVNIKISYFHILRKWHLVIV